MSPLHPRSIVHWKALLVPTALSVVSPAQAQGPRLARPPRPTHVLHVPGDSTTVQGAIERAQGGDVVIVAPGTYRERIDFLGKAIEVIGTEGPARTILRGTSASPVVLFRNSEGPDSRLMGFTIQGGSGDFEGSGGGVSCSGFGPVASPYLSDCVIQLNFTDPIFGNGPGAAGLDGNATLERCVFRNNETYFDSGGAVKGAVTALQCVFERNWGCEGGGGLHLLPGSLVQDCVLRDNTAGPCGYHGDAIQALGGGILAPFGPVEIVGCVLQGNSVFEWTESGDPTSCNGSNTGGGVHAGSGVKLRRCTVVANRAEMCALVGGIEGSPVLVDSIVYANGDAPGQYAAQSSFRFSDVQGGAAGPACIDADPLFVDAGSGDLRLRAGSPCIDAGDPASPLDPDGTHADLGAFHRPSEGTLLGVAWHEASRLGAQAPANHFGAALAIDGNTALVGAAELGYGGAVDESAHVLRRAGSSWRVAERLAQSDPSTGDRFGAAVALQGNVAIVGAPHHDTLGDRSQDGAVYVFERRTSDAPFQQTLRLVPAGQRPNGRFGYTLALDDGFLVVAAVGGGATPGDELGHVFVFQRLARGRWNEVAVFTPPYFFGDLSVPFFGAALAISGTTIVVGAPWFQTDSHVPGRAFVYERAGATPHSWVQAAVLAPTDTRGHGNFGSTVSIAGDALLIGSDFGVYAYERGGPGLPWNRAARIGPIEPTRVVAERGRAWLARNSGEVRELFQTSPGAGWSEVGHFLAPPGPIAAQGSTVLCGAPFEDSLVGAVRVFTRGVQLDSIAHDQAADEEEVVLSGLDLDTVTQVLVGGVEQPIVRQGTRELVLRPARRDPGFADLELRSSLGALTLPLGFESLPSLRVSPAGPGEVAEVRVDIGTSGAFALLASFDLRAAPIPFADPPTWYGLWLDLVPGRSGRIAVAGVDASGRATLALPVPNIPALAGFTLHLQAWCRRGLFGPGRYAFTNRVSATL